ncbi:hypothetical protein SNE40_008215 [Patella caerulea]|uniref:T-cell immunomodulatory protein TIP C2 domain-containing protein n=1 Tax=Patella caerulea TaxID=87958 RepID=A0AAN8PUU7_PATCE
MSQNDMMWTLTVFVSLLFLNFTKHCQGSFSDTSSGIFGRTKNGLLAAFGDFNADKATDVFILSDDGKSIQLVLGTTEKIDASYSEKELISKSQTNDTYIVNVVPADFDGDSMMDVMVTRRNEGVTDGPLQVVIYWGNILKSNLDTIPLVIKETFADQPAIIDVNGDMIPDLLGEISMNGDKQRTYWIFGNDRNYTLETVKNETTSAPLAPLHIPQSSAFLDFNMDLTADLITVSDESGKIQFEIWLNQKGKLVWNQTIVSPEELKSFGQPIFLDMDNDHSVDIVLPGCTDTTDCITTSAIYVWSKNKWYKLHVKFNDGTNQWGFLKDNTIPTLSVPINLRMGDLNLDGFPDALTVLSWKKAENKSQVAYVLKNVGCSTCDGFSRTFTIQFSDPLTKQSTIPVLVAFFDIGENGVLDIVLSNYQDKKTHLQALSQVFTEDAYFVKIMVLSGLCKDDCPAGHQRYGVNQVGPAVRYETVNSNGDQQIGIASQLTQSAYFSLQLPFTVFGLGQTPNFVDTLEVGVPYPAGKSPRHKAFTSIIPNSRLVITPYELDSPNSWSNKLFITPSRLVLLTGAALLGTCGFIAIIVGILHWRDRVQDKREKLQDAHKFHFDAM